MYLKRLTIFILSSGISCLFIIQVTDLFYRNSEFHKLETRTKYLNIISAEYIFPDVSGAVCTDVPKDAYAVQFTLCSNDKFITESMLERRYFEVDEVRLVLSSLLNYPNSLLLDIGSNMGIFSLVAAKSGHNVIAVDAIATNLAILHKSMGLNQVENKIKLVNNAISDVHEVHYAGLDWPGNNMAVRMVTQEDLDLGKLESLGKEHLRNIGLSQYADSLQEMVVDTKNTIQSIVLGDIFNIINEDTVIIKIDVEGYECKVLTKFLQTLQKPRYVPYILMEWALIQTPTGKRSTCPQYNNLVQGFVDSGYEAFSPNNTQIEDLKRYVWNNIFWKHKSAKDVEYLTQLQKSGFYL